MRRLRFDSPYLLLLLTVLFWSGNWVVGRGFRGQVPPVALAFWRWTIAFACTLPFAWPHLPQIGTALRQHAGILVLLALLGITGYNTLTYIGLQHTTATNGVLLNSFIPIVIIGLSWAFLGKRLSPREIAGVLISLGGVTVIVAHGDPATLATLSLNPGDLWIMVSVFVWAGYTLLLQFRPAGLHPMAMLAILTAIGVITLAPVYAWELAQGRTIHATPAALAGVLYTGIFPGFLGYVFWNRAVAQVGGPVSGLFIHLMPVFTPLLSAVFLGETPHAYHFAGMALILGGILLTTLRRALK
ncbi:DMT family transporter [Niveibacterium umoris]|uniref:Drug/metabolite transporter (DMT)-like permease n=1 Tax=Niveibacterium umoris TaxID=1193620 RepID=A0A840BPC3_9RHOO|nr:DMT family transporter [Niveibacterium umoris]MBB4014850.1 drug/metabolite transporter (DMT)-like permease [Niveibacterium umoris]